MKSAPGLSEVAILSLLTLAACGGGEQKAEQKAPPPTPVAVYTVQRENATYYDQFPATVTPLNEVEIRPQVAGYITGIFFTDGQKVSKGQKLYEIDRQQYKATYDQAVANLNAAQANQNRAQKDADRYNTLAKQDAIARQVLDNAEAELQSTKMQVEAAKANVRLVETNLRYSTIYAPFAGTIGISQARLGAAVVPGSTLLNTISTNNPMAVDIQVDEKQISRFAALNERKQTPRDSVFTLLLPDGSVYPQIGSIGIIDRAVDPQTGTIRIRMVFPNPQDRLKAGLSGTARIKNNTGTPQLLIPYKAVTEQMSEYFVFVADSNKVSQRKITLGQRIADKVVIKEGLRENEVIVTEGIQKLKEGSPIQVAPNPNAGQQVGAR
ncbi:efflux RND transporter periplasmic adaptor subunit [Tellurirhabdus bombi]|uniref:efflux RND transporter periplasmic adaptor subunit n=1 Tax=Tellurirhabdus bombi TaxID=2907205 RepID=UPI001F2995C4|nr:efflux RND transporter periplasmic adaptor subunit [Tellurirhabdus bombi]